MLFTLLYTGITRLKVKICRKIAAKLHKKPEISLIICTHNRAAVLDESLAYYSAIQSEIPFEILIVVNACTDKTLEVISRHSKRLKNIRHIVEPTTGASYARNTGWQNAAGSMVFYIDDDAYPSSSVIDDIYLLTEDKSIKSFTGRTRYWRGDDPKWIKAEYVEMPKLSDEVFPMKNKGHINGCACGFYKSVLANVGGFRLDLDMKGKKLGYGVEEEMRLKLLKSGVTTYYVPHIEVRHKAHNKTVVQYFSSAINKGKYHAKVKRTSFIKTLLLFLSSALKAIPAFIIKLMKMPYQNASVEAFSRPLNYLGQLIR